MSNWGTLIQEVIGRAGGGRGSTNDTDLVKQAAVTAIARHDSKHFFFNEQRNSIATVANQVKYTTADGLPDNIVRFLSPWIEVDREQDSDDTYRIRRVSPATLDRLRIGITSTSEPEAWSYFDETLEIYPEPDTVHDLNMKVVVKPGVPQKSYSGGSWSFTKPDGTAMANDYPAAGETNAWFTDPLAYEVIAAYTEYLMWSGSWHGSKGQEQKALQRYAELLSELEDRTIKLREPRSIEPMDLGALEVVR